MRSLDACKAEIFRRSEIKIKQQKKVRNRVLAACVPVCLCVVIGAAGAFSGAFDAKSGNMAQAPESAGWNNNGFGLMDAETSLGEDICVSENTSNWVSEDAEGLEKPQFGERPILGLTSKLTVTAENENYEILKEILLNLDYSPYRVCRCLPQYRLETDFGEFGIHLSQAYARCKDGQANLTAEQVKTLRQIIENITDKKTNE